MLCASCVHVSPVVMMQLWSWLCSCHPLLLGLPQSTPPQMPHCPSAHSTRPDSCLSSLNCAWPSWTEKPHFTGLQCMLHPREKNIFYVSLVCHTVVNRTTIHELASLMWHITFHFPFGLQMSQNLEATFSLMAIGDNNIVSILVKLLKGWLLFMHDHMTYVDVFLHALLV